MSSVSPSPAPLVGTIKADLLCWFATRRCRAAAVSKEEALVALGAISNLYCLYALEHPESTTTRFQGFVSEEIAPIKAVLDEIMRALPRTDKEQASSILTALSQSLDAIFVQENYRRARFLGFGILQAMDLARSEYSLSLELPLAEFLRADRASRDKGATAHG
jgi:hypothetical protein